MPLFSRVFFKCCQYKSLNDVNKTVNALNLRGTNCMCADHRKRTGTIMLNLGIKRFTANRLSWKIWTALRTGLFQMPRRGREKNENNSWIFTDQRQHWFNFGQWKRSSHDLFWVCEESLQILKNKQKQELKSIPEFSPLFQLRL